MIRSLGGCTLGPGAKAVPPNLTSVTRLVAETRSCPATIKKSPATLLNANVNEVEVIAATVD